MASRRLLCRRYDNSDCRLLLLIVVGAVEDEEVVVANVSLAHVLHQSTLALSCLMSDTATSRGSGGAQQFKRHSHPQREDLSSSRSRWTTYSTSKARLRSCLTQVSATWFFILGMPPSSRTRTFVATPMLRFSQAPTLYRVLLRGITVEGQRLNVPATVFAAGSVMDSRTAITHLPPTAYQALRAAFRSRMGAYRLASPKGSLDTCYDFAGVLVVRVPRVALVFDRNAAVELDPSGILLDDCLAFAPNGDDRAPGIIGNVQQQTIEVLYDVGGRSVGFRRGAC